LTNSAGCPASLPRDRCATHIRVRGARIPVRVALVASLGVAVMWADAAHAQFYDPYYGRPYGYGSGYGRPYGYGGRSQWFEPARPYYQKPRRKPVETPTTTAPTTNTTPTTKTTKKEKEQTVKPPQGPLLVAVSINSQRLTVYARGSAIAHSPVSTGVATHPTPTGIFSVIGKERFHRSNLYSNAPMPWMQRITWSGVAIHQGVLPGYPASHGCIRIPEKFAQYLWGTTRMGARVIITPGEVTPFEIEHAKLFAPKPAAEPEPLVAAAGRPLQVAESETPVRASDAPRPAALADTAGGGGALKGSLGVAAASAEDTKDAIQGSVSLPAQAATVTAAESVEKRGRTAARELNDPPRMSDPVSVFISRKTGRLYVRQGTEPQFDAAVTIRDPEMPLGTHLYTATELKPDQTAMRWVAVTLSNQGVAATAEPEHRRSTRKHQDHERAAVPAAVRLAASSALDRIDIPKDVQERIADVLSPGASLIISDQPISHETGKYTDFIILTR
jgi:lipoprotein-anchoring transpeptidase ErfK/SrfK